MSDYIPRNLDLSVGIPFSMNIWKICLAIVMGYKK